MESSGNPLVSTQVLTFLKTGIANQRWKVGEKLPTEKALCEELGVSRSSVRSALQQLTSLGMVKTIQGSGTYVCSHESAMPLNAIAPTILLNQTDLLSILEFRRIVEVSTVELAAQRATTEEVNAMFRVAEQMANATVPADIVKYDIDFHSMIAEATRNFAIIKVFEIVRESYLSLLENNVAFLGTHGAKQHVVITTAIAMRSPEQAKQAMTEHLDQSDALYFDIKSKALDAQTEKTSKNKKEETAS